MNTTIQEAQDRREGYFLMWEQNYDADLSNSQTLDKSILGLSAVFLIVTFYQMTQADASQILMPIAAMFIIAKICVFASLYTSYKGLEICRWEIAEYYEKSSDDFSLSKRWGKLTRRLNWLGVKAFFVGLIGLVITFCVRI